MMNEALKKKSLMASPKQFSLAELAVLTNSQLIGDPAHYITNVADLETAESCDASFLANPRYEHLMHQSRAGVIFVNCQSKVIPGRNFLINHHPSKAFQQIIDKLYEEAQELTGFTKIHPTAVIHETCQIGNEVSIGPLAVLDKNVIIGNHTFIGSSCYIGPSTIIGEHCILHPHVTIRERCQLKDRVILQSGVVIGSCGFGYVTDPITKEHCKLNQVGNVILEDDVEIGANTTIDRSRFQTTRIGKGTKIDNLVQIGHGVQIGPHNLIVAQTGIAGSTITGKNVTLAGQVGVNGHITIGHDVVVAAKSGVSKSLEEAGIYGGIPAIPIKEYNRLSVYLRKIEDYIKEIKELKAKVVSLENRFL